MTGIRERITYAEDDTGFSLMLDEVPGWLGWLKAMDLDNSSVPNRGVHNMLDVAWLVGLVLGSLALAPFMQGFNPPLIVTALAIGAALLFAIRLYADRWVDAHPCATIEVRHGVVRVVSRLGTERFKAPLEQLEIDVNGSTLSLKGPTTCTINTAFHDEETLHWVHDRVLRAIAGQGSPKLVPEALRRRHHHRQQGSHDSH